MGHTRSRTPTRRDNGYAEDEACRMIAGVAADLCGLDHRVLNWIVLGEVAEFSVVICSIQNCGDEAR